MNHAFCRMNLKLRSVCLQNLLVIHALEAELIVERTFMIVYRKCNAGTNGKSVSYGLANVEFENHLRTTFQSTLTWKLVQRRPP